MLSYMYDDIKELVRNVLQLFVKYEVIEKCKTASAYKQIDLSDKSNILPKSKFNIGRAVDITIAEMKQKDMVMKYQLDTFKQVFLLFLLATTRKLLDKTKLGTFIMCYASSRNASHLTNLASSSESFKLLIGRLVYLKILPTKTGDKALSQFSGFILNYVKEEPGKNTSFNPKKQRIDDFYFNCLTNMSEHKELCDVLKFIFKISHGQADVERRFSPNKNLLNQKMEALTITSRQKVKDHLISNKTEMLQYVQST